MGLEGGEEPFIGAEQQEEDEGPGVFSLTSVKATNDPPAATQGQLLADEESRVPLATAGGSSGKLPTADARAATAASRFTNVVNETAARARAAVEEGTEEHWNHVMKKLAPHGYNQTPVWQRQILERVLKRMTTRDPAHGSKPLTEKHSMSATDLAVSALSPDAGAPLKADASAVQRARERAADKSAVTAARLAQRKRVHNRQNKIHFYNRGIQMEQLLSQDLDNDLRHMRAEVHISLREARGGEARATEEAIRIQRKEKALANRLQVLVQKTNALEADNDRLVGEVDDLRSERALVLQQLKRMRDKENKMDEDMQFLSTAANGALDQREKVKAKLLQTQRDSSFEKAHKLNQIAELLDRGDALDVKRESTEAVIEDLEQQRRRREYVLGKQRRLAQTQAEAKRGFLQSQVVGWDSEFSRLQEFTGMDKRFAPGDEQTIEEITSRYLSKDQQNTSLLRYVHAQQKEVEALETDIRHIKAEKAELISQIERAIDSDSAPVMDYEGLAQREAEAAFFLESQLTELCDKVANVTAILVAKANQPAPGDGACSLSNIEEHLQTQEAITSHLQADWRARYARSRVRTQGVLHQWVTPKPARQRENIDDIHERLVITAVNAQQLGAEDEDEDIDRRNEQVVTHSPFSRRKLNKSHDRSQLAQRPRPSGSLGRTAGDAGQSHARMPVADGVREFGVVDFKRKGAGAQPADTAPPRALGAEEGSTMVYVTGH